MALSQPIALFDCIYFSVDVPGTVFLLINMILMVDGNKYFSFSWGGLFYCALLLCLYIQKRTLMWLDGVLAPPGLGALTPKCNS